MPFVLVFDEVMLKQLKAAARQQQLKELLSRMLDKLELLGPRAGDLLDSRLSIYELKHKSPPIRIYYRHDRLTDEIHVFSFDMKTSQIKQQQTIDNLRARIRGPSS
jgi:hypothetical protein